MGEAILLQIGRSGPRNKGIKRSTSGVRKSRSQAVEVRLGDLAEPSFSTS